MSFSGLLSYMEDLVALNPSVVLPDNPDLVKDEKYEKRKRKPKTKSSNFKIKDKDFTTADLCYSL